MGSGCGQYGQHHRSYYTRGDLRIFCDYQVYIYDVVLVTVRLWSDSVTTGPCFWMSVLDVTYRVVQKEFVLHKVLEECSEEDKFLRRRTYPGQHKQIITEVYEMIGINCAGGESSSVGYDISAGNGGLQQFGSLPNLDGVGGKPGVTSKQNN